MCGSRAWRLALGASVLCALLLVVRAAGGSNPLPWRRSAEVELRCDSSTIRRANRDHLRQVLAELANTTYFRLFRVQLDGACPLDSPGKSAGEVCSGGALGGGGPGSSALFGGAKGRSSSGGGGGAGSSAADAKGGACHVDPTLVDKTLSPRESRQLQHTAEECDDDGLPTFWLDLCSRLPFNDSTEQYVNLQLNPETYTGYNGSAVWAEIYRNDCVEDVDTRCYEERFLFRLLSGLHASINLHISKSFYPPKKGVREGWGANVARFKEHFAGHSERLNNLQFAFVVLLRAIHKAGPVLEKFNYEALLPEETARTRALVSMFLASSVLSSCQDVFSAFDERLLFNESEPPVKRRFKQVFHNVSTAFNCIKCQKCRLHGKLQLLGIGTAIKLLLVPENMIRDSLTREEVVALFNTVEKLSESLDIYSELAQLAELEPPRKVQGAGGAGAAASPADSAAAAAAAAAGAGAGAAAVNAAAATAAMAAAAAAPPAAVPAGAFSPIELSLHAVASSGGALAVGEQDLVVDAALDRDEEVLLLARHFAQSDPAGFLRHALRRLAARLEGGRELQRQPQPQLALPVVVLGAGLSGMTVTLSILDRGGSVVLVDKEAVAGGNSAKASSGINGLDESSGPKYNDSTAQFKADILRGSGVAPDAPNLLVDLLVDGSVEALAWLRTRVHLPLEEVGQLGGHSRKRTWRPSTGLAGSEMIAGLNKALKETAAALPAGRFVFMRKTRASRLLHEGGVLQGVEVVDLATGAAKAVRASAVVVATGGYAYHKAPGSLLHDVRPDLDKFATTNGDFATGDGIVMAMQAGAATVDLDQVQVHPTAFVDPKNRTHPVKTLAAELLRGVGAVILAPDGSRFVNELGTRKMVSEKMMQLSASDKLPEFIMVLNAEMAAQAPKHIPMYEKKGLLVRHESLEALAKATGMPSAAKLRDALAAYDEAASGRAKDPYGRTVFPPGSMLQSAAWYAGIIQPAVHYCMGGLRVDAAGHVLDAAGKPLLHGAVFAVGEATGGIHGENRLGGNALTECTVFGRIVGQGVPIGPPPAPKAAPAPAAMPAAVPLAAAKTAQGTPASAAAAAAAAAAASRDISRGELALHKSKADCWVALHGRVYDISGFIDDHPGGPESIVHLCGRDGTKEFAEIHSETMLVDFDSIGQAK